VDAYAVAQFQRPDAVQEYNTNSIKVVLACPSLEAMKAAEKKAIAAGLPCVRITEEDGTITTVGIGPARKSECNKITRDFRLHP
jgi:peptidyl-tRNA hydrolase